MQPDGLPPRKSRSSTSCSGRRLLLAAAFLAMVAPIKEGRAQQNAKAQAEAKLADVKRLVNKGAFAEALPMLMETMALYPSPKLHFNFGVVYQGMGRDKEALEAFSRYLAQVEQPAMEQEARRRIRELRQRVDKRANEIVAGVPQAIDVGPSPAATAAAPAPPDSRPNPFARSEKPPEQPPPPAAAPSSPSEAGPANRETALPPGLIEDQPAPASTSLSRPLALGTAAVAVAAVGFGVWKNLRGADQARTFNDYRGPAGGPRIVCGEDDPQRGSPGCEDLYNSARSTLRLAYVSYGLGALLAAGSVMLYLESSSPAGQTNLESVAFGCTPVPGSWSINCALRF